MSMINGEQQRWAEKYSSLIQEVYEKWQKPLGIDNQYQQFLKEELSKDFNDPLKKELFESSF